MSNPATKAPNFTRENAAEMARRATVSRLAREAREKAESTERDIAARARLLAPSPEDARKQTTLIQLDKLDRLIDKALDDDDTDLFLKLTQAKARLWELVSPTAGTLKPSRQTQRGQVSNPLAIQPRQSPPAPPAQIETPQQVVVAPQIQGETPQN